MSFDNNSPLKIGGTVDLLLFCVSLGHPLFTRCGLFDMKKKHQNKTKE